MRGCGEVLHKVLVSGEGEGGDHDQDFDGGRGPAGFLPESGGEYRNDLLNLALPAVRATRLCGRADVLSRRKSSLC